MLTVVRVTRGSDYIGSLSFECNLVLLTLDLRWEIMTHADKGKYFQKHPASLEIDEVLKKEILRKVKENAITCAAAEEIARGRSDYMGAVGTTLDILNINIVECQLGLFGYNPQKKVVQPAKEVSAGLKDEIGKVLVNGRLPCSAAWEISRKLNLPRMRVSAACEALQIKIKPCQLGAF
jgi:hypothetical protein